MAEDDNDTSYVLHYDTEVARHLLVKMVGPFSDEFSDYKYCMKVMCMHTHYCWDICLNDERTIVVALRQMVVKLRQLRYQVECIHVVDGLNPDTIHHFGQQNNVNICLLYTSDAADE